MPDSFRLRQNQVNPTWNIKRFFPSHFLRYLKFFTIPFIKYPLSFLTTYETFYIGPAQWLVTSLLAPNHLYLHVIQFLTQWKTKKHFLPFWECELICFPDALLRCLWMSFIYHLKTVYQQDDKVKNSLTLHVQPICNFMKIHIEYHFCHHNEIDSYINHEWRLDYVSCNSTSHFE